MWGKILGIPRFLRRIRRRIGGTRGAAGQRPLIGAHVTTPAPPHRPSCARAIRVREEQAGRSQHDIADLIHQHCGVSRLRSYRLALGKTLAVAGREVRALALRHDPEGPRVEGDQLSSWETGGREPRRAVVNVLCAYYGATPRALGLSGEPPATSTTEEALLPVPAVASSSSLADRVDAARRSTNSALAAGTVAGGQIDLLDERLLLLRRQYLYTPPETMLTQLLEELDDVEALVRERQTTSVHVRLTEMTALLATLIADSLMKLGDLRRSGVWYETARFAAEESGNRDLRARVRAQAAMLPYYYGPLDTAIALAREARLLTRGRPTATAAFATMAEARALAQTGDSVQAELRLKEAALMYERLPSGADDDAFAFPRRRYLLYLSGTYTALGRTSAAMKTQAEAIALYPVQTGIDPSLLHLETAICLAMERSATEACQLATAVYLQVPEEHRTPIIGARARGVIEKLPGASGRTRAAMELRELLALPEGPK
ncbi:helix-turn-helix domain-containing protein [Streptomyces sp. NPDC001553]|uniref:helix-turn-helix domain-containing protein n=1 Tax=Streptomyces sp. NPDC001553 TaxID=3154385 RepID=UPI003326FEBF